MTEWQIVFMCVICWFIGVCVWYVLVGVFYKRDPELSEYENEEAFVNAKIASLFWPIILPLWAIIRGLVAFVNLLEKLSEKMKKELHNDE